MILTVCSKNDMSDVMRMFREHSEMILKEEHIACFQVNWNNKADNIRKISDILNIELHSMVFIDDSNFEVELVKQLLPEVTTIKYKRDTVYGKLSCFNLKSDVDIDKIRQRNNTYKTNEQRVKLKDSSKSFENYLNLLDMKIDIHPTLQMEYARVAELTQRTNKCTNGKRYTVANIKERTSLGVIKLYSVCVSDCFSDLGLVGAFEIEGESLTLFSLSCRALGRKVEQKMAEYILSNHQIDNVVFKSTDKNDGLKLLLLKMFPNTTLSTHEDI